MVEDPSTKTFSCKKCDSLDEWRGPLTVPAYECKKCEGLGKIYKRDQTSSILKPQQCVCDEREYITAGDTCIPNQFRDAYPDTFRAEYQSVESNG